MCQALGCIAGLLICLHEAFLHYLPHKIPSLLSTAHVLGCSAFSLAVQLQFPTNTKALEIRDGVSFTQRVPSVPSTKADTLFVKLVWKSSQSIQQDKPSQKLTSHTVNAVYFAPLTYSHDKVPKHMLLMSRKKEPYVIVT